MRTSMRWVAAAVTGLSLNAAQAAIVPGGRLFVLEDNVEIIATFLDGAGAGHLNTLLLVAPSAVGPIFNNHVDAIGSTFSLGSFATDTELTFAIDSDNSIEVIRYFTGAAAANPDNFIHALIDDAIPDPNAPGFTLVAVRFEDIFGGGDQNYTDMVFSLNNIRVLAAPVPLPLPLALLSTGIAGVLASRRRKVA